MASSADSHHRSLWSATAAEPAIAAAALAGEMTVDLAVVGGGITGCTAALTAAEAGASTVLLEGRTIGWGASGRNGGQVIPGLKYDPSEMRAKLGEAAGRELTATVGAAADAVFQRIGTHAIDCAAKREGWIQAAHAPPALARVHQRARDWEAEGAPVALLDAPALERLTGARTYLGGWIDRRAGTLHPLSYTRGLARAAREAGADLHESTPVEALEQDADGWRLRTPEGLVRARRVVVATDAYSSGLVAGLPEAMLLVQSVQVATETLPDTLLARLLPEGRCCSETRRLAFYFRRSTDGRLLFGGRGAIGDVESPVLRQALVAAMRRIFPEVAGVPIACSWSGQVGLTLDGLPRLQEPAPGLHLGYGYNGRGVAMATLMGGWLARKALKGERPPLPATAISPISWHRLRRPALSAGIAWAWLRDRVGLAG